jgi:hypothetical protein
MILVRQANDLRFVGIALEGSHILVVVDEISAITERRLELLVAAAKLRRIVVSAVWQGPSEHADAARLKRLTDASGGRFVAIRDAAAHSGIGVTHHPHIDLLAREIPGRRQPRVNQ